MARLLKFNLKYFCDIFEQWQANDFDGLVIIDGNRGLGKSTLAHKLLSKTKAEQRFKPRKDICYSRKNLIRNLANKKKGCILADEIINVVYNRDHYEKEQKMLLKALNMIRDSGNIFIGCVPTFTTLDTQMRELCKLRFTVIRRGIALVHAPKQLTSGQDKWCIKTTQRIENKWGKRGIIHPKYGQLPTVVGILNFSDLSKKQKRIYLKIKQKKRNQVLREYESDSAELAPEMNFYKRVMQRVKLKQLTPRGLRDICFANGKKYRSVREELNDMLKKEGITTTLRDYVSNNNALVVKKDSQSKKRESSEGEK